MGGGTALGISESGRGRSRPFPSSAMAAGSWYPGGGIVYVEGQEIENGSTSGHTGEEPREARAEKVDAELAIRASTLAPEDLDSSVWYNVRTSFSSGWVRLSPLAMVSRIVPLSLKLWNIRKWAE